MFVTLEEMKNYLSINNSAVTVQLTISEALGIWSLTRASGSWTAAGAVVGTQLKLAGFVTSANNTTVTVTEVTSATVVKFAVVSGVAAEVGPTTTSVRIEVTTHDSFLNEQILFVQEVIENYCGRKFEETDYVQTFYRQDFEPEQMRKLMAYHYPITSITSFEEVDTETEEAIDMEDYRVHKPTGMLVADVSPFFSNADSMVLTYSAGYETIPAPIRSVVYSIVQERYNKKISGVSLNFGSDVQRISIPGTISVDFDYSLSSNERTNSYGAILGSQANIIDPYRSDRTLGTSKIAFVEEDEA